MKTEYEFTLPRGFVDEEGNLHREGWMRLARAKDALAPLSDPRVQKNQNYLILILISRVVTKLGSLKLVNPPVIEKLFSADLAYLIDFYRQINGSFLNRIGLTCSQCGKPFEGTLELSGELSATP